MNEKRYPVSLWEQAKKDYMAGTFSTTQELCDHYGLNINTVHDRIYKGRQGCKPWRAEKLELENEVKAHAVEQAKKYLAKVYKVGSDVALRVLEDIDSGLKTGKYESRELPSILEKTVSAMAKANAVLRLEDGKATQHIAVNHSQIANNLNSALKDLKDRGLLNIEDADIEIMDE